MQKVNGRRMPSDGKRSHYLWQGELKTKHMIWHYVFTSRHQLFMIENIQNNK